MRKLKLTNTLFGFNKIALVAALGTLVVLLPVWWLVNLGYAQFLLTGQRNQVSAEVSARANVLSSIINSRFSRLAAIKAFTELHKNSDAIALEFADFAESVHNNSVDIRNFIIAPDGINKYVYPVAGNEVALGHNLFTDSRPNVRADVARAKDTGQVTISGPYELRQGGLGLVARQAIYNNQGQFWGIVSMVLDLPPILAEADLTNSPSPLLLALRDKRTETVFFGPGQIFEQTPVIFTISLIEGSWELAGLPANGWNASIKPTQTIVQFSTLLIVILFSYLVYSTVNRQTRLSEAVNKQTRQFVQANLTLQQEVAERQQIEADLIASEQQYRLLAEHSTDLIAVIDTGLQIAYVSPSVERYFGYTPDELMGQEIDGFLTPAILQKSRQFIDRLTLREGDTFKLEQEFRRKNGSVFWAEVILSPLLDDNQQLLGTLVTLRDVTERRLAENALRESERRFRDVLENVALAAIMLDTTGCITFCNNFLLELTGWQRHEVLGQSWFEYFIPAHIRDEILAIFSDTVTIGLFPPHHQNAIVTCSGEERLIDWSNTAYSNSQGQIMGITSLGIDITEQQQTLAALKESESRHRIISELISDYVYSARIFPDGSTQTEWISGAFTKITGLSPAEILAEPDVWVKHIHPDDVPQTKGIHQALHNYPMVVKEYRVITATGQTRWLKDHIRPLWNEDRSRVVRIIGAVEDITEQKQAADKLHDSLYEKEVMLKELHHRVKNNLQIITSLLSLQADTIHDEGTRQALGDSRSRVRSMALVHEMLYLSDNLAQIEIAPYFQSVAKNLFSIFQSEQTKAVLECAIEPIMLSLDTAIPCGLIVNELISNALKHAFPAHHYPRQPDTSNKIRLQFTRISPEHLQLIVADNGIGIPPNFTLKNSHSLGLQLVNILTQQLNGQLEIKNKSGACFKVTFPEHP